MTEKIWANSGDSHFLEPPDLFTTGLPAHLAARMPRSVKDPDGLHETVYVDGQELRRKIPAVERKAGKDGKTMIEANASVTLGGRDMDVRLKDLDGEGVWGEVVYPSLGMWQVRIRDPKLALAGAQVLNDFAKSEIHDKSPRMVCAASVPMLDPDDAAQEARRVASLGFHAVFLPVSVPEGVNAYNWPTWEPLWTACEEAGLVVAFHIGSGIEKLDLWPGDGSVLMNYTETSFPGQRCAIQMVAGGALERHPELRVLVSEGGGSWVPFVGDRMNEAFRQHHGFVRPRLELTPKEYLYRQVYTTFQHDESAVGAMTAQGYENIMWGSDYPHVEGTFGHTQEVLHHLFDDVDPAVRARITRGAFLDLFPHVGEPPLGEAA